MGDSPIHNQDSIIGEKTNLSLRIRSAEMSSGANHSPPWEISAGSAENGADSPCRPGEPCFGGNLAISDHVAWLETGEHLDDRVLEPAHTVPKRRSPMSPRPGAM